MQDPQLTEIAGLKKRLAGIFAAAAVCILAGGLAYHHHYQTVIRKDAADLLSSIKSFKTDQILFWRADRINDTESLLDTPVLSVFLNRLAGNPDDKALRAQMRSRLQTYLKHNRYRSALLALPDGTVVTAAGENPKALPEEAKALIRKTLASGKTELGDFYVGPSGRPRIDLVSKAATGNNGKKLFLLLEIAPDDYLYPLLQAWPTNSRTGETVLARKEGRDVLFLGDLRHAENAGMKLRLPLSGSNLPIVRALNGEAGVVLGSDYRGIKVLASISLIPGTNWGIVVKTDWEEIMAETGRLSALILLFTLFLVTAAGGWAYLLFRVQAGKYSRAIDTAAAELRESEQIFESFMRHSPVYVFFKDKEIRSLRLSKNYETMLGRPLRELLGKSMDDLFPSELARSMIADDKRILEEGKQVAVEEAFNGRNYRTIKFPVELEGGKRYLAGYTIDITEQKQSADKLKSVAREWETTFNAIDDVVWTLDAEHRIVRANAATGRLFPHDAAMVVGRRCWEIVHGTTGPVPECPVQRARQSMRREIMEYRLRGRIFEVVADPIPGPAGEYAGAVHILRDITERKKTEETLLASEARYQHLFDKMEEGFATHEIICDEEGRPADYKFLSVNPAFERLTGLKGADIAGKRVLEVMPQTEKVWIEKYGRVALTGEPMHFESYAAALGKWYEVSAFRPREGQFAVSFFDITEQKKAQLELEKAGNELRETQKVLLKNLRLYSILAQINQAAAQTKDIKKLYTRLCEVAVSAGGFRMAWVGYPDRDTGRVLPICSAGDAAGYLDHIKISVKEGTSSKGPTGTAARTGRIAVSQDIASDPDMAPWKDKALEKGYLSSAALPLHDGPTLVSVLSLYSSEKDFFNADEIKLLTEIKDDVSLAIEAISAEEKHSAAQNTLERTTAHLTHMMEATPVILFTLRLLNGRLLPQWVSGNSESITGHDPAELLSPAWFETAVHPEDKDWVISEMKQIFAKGTLSHDFRLAKKDGSGYVWVHSQLRAGPEGSGEITGTWTDITPLKESEMRFKKLFEKNPLACRPPAQAGRDEIFMLDPETSRFSFASLGALKNLGYTRTEIEQKKPWEIVKDLTEDSYKALLTPLVKKQKQLLIIEAEHVRKDGTCYPVQTRLQLLEVSTGPVVMILSTEIREEQA